LAHVMCGDGWLLRSTRRRKESKRFIGNATDEPAWRVEHPS
jgi:hypothetical protein